MKDSDSITVIIPGSVKIALLSSIQLLNNLLLIVLKVPEISNFVRPLHCSNADSSKESIFSNLSWVIFPHDLNAPEPIDLNVFGNETEARFVQLQNALSLIDVRSFLISMDWSLEKPQKQLLSITLTRSMYIETTFESIPNTMDGKVLMFPFILTVLRFNEFKNMLQPIELIDPVIVSVESLENDSNALSLITRSRAFILNVVSAQL